MSPDEHLQRLRREAESYRDKQEIKKWECRYYGHKPQKDNKWGPTKTCTFIGLNSLDKYVEDYPDVLVDIWAPDIETLEDIQSRHPEAKIKIWVPDPDSGDPYLEEYMYYTFCWRSCAHCDAQLGDYVINGPCTAFR